MAPLVREHSETSCNAGPEDQPRVFRGDGGLSSTAVDYIRFEQMVLNDGRLNGAVVLSPTSIALNVYDLFERGTYEILQEERHP